MKRSIGKLSLGKQTISNLTRQMMQIARGGIVVSDLPDMQEDTAAGTGRSKVSCADKTCETTVVGDICACYTTCPCPDNIGLR
jgi:hypothetical protein